MRAVAAAVLLVSTFAFAQTANGTKAPPKERTTHVDFETDDLIDGVRAGPLGGVIDSRRPTTFSNLIKVRQDFSDKLLESVHAL
ncbi:MAG: hypothetical protein K1X89_10855 [Myxococcaceae bacterium]|nr:hypothetical protein [Myxococcaceae bacterium]